MSRFFRLLLEDIPAKYLLGEDVSPRKSSERRCFAQKIFCHKILGTKNSSDRRCFPEEFSIRKRSKENEVLKMTINKKGSKQQ